MAPFTAAQCRGWTLLGCGRALRLVAWERRRQGSARHPTYTSLASAGRGASLAAHHAEYFVHLPNVALASQGIGRAAIQGDGVGSPASLGWNEPAPAVAAYLWFARGREARLQIGGEVTQETVDRIIAHLKLMKEDFPKEDSYQGGQGEQHSERPAVAASTP